MSQHLNLADPRLLPRTVAFGAGHALAAVLGVFAIGAVAAGTLHALAARTAAGAAAVAPPVAAAPVAAGATPVLDAAAFKAEVDALRQLDAGQRRIRAALDAGAAGEREGPSAYFVALARQARGSVWITGLAIAEHGAAIDLEGRMTHPDALPEYLRRLNAEPRFRGRPFAQLHLSTVDRGTGQPLPYTEFALRSKPTDGGTR